MFASRPSSIRSILTRASIRRSSPINRRAYAESPKGTSSSDASNLANGPTHQGPTPKLRKANYPVIALAFVPFLAFVSYPYLRGPAQTKRLLAEKNVELTGTTSQSGGGRNDHVLTDGRPQ